MRTRLALGLVGDHDDTVTAHRAIPLALQAAARACGASVESEWLPTESIATPARLERFDGLWCVPASPYRSMEGALLAIGYARERGVPFLGTCGGFQHALVEYARSVLGWHDAEHAETAPGHGRAVVAPLSCGLVEVSSTVRLLPGTRIAAAYRHAEANEQYHCRYGLNPALRDELLRGPLRVGAEDTDGEVRAVELDGHPFFVATLFQPERAALAGHCPPLALAFVEACAARPFGAA